MSLSGRYPVRSAVENRAYYRIVKQTFPVGVLCKRAEFQSVRTDVSIHPLSGKARGWKPRLPPDA